MLFVKFGIMSVFVFYFILLKEIVLFPILYLYEFIDKKFILNRLPVRSRKPVESRVVHVNIHEWGKYSLRRNKKVNNIKPFECGLYYQLERFNICKKKYDIDLTVTISDASLCKDISYIESKCNRIIRVDNLGFDFSGYSAFYDRIKENKNSYVILSNTSVNSVIHEFLEDYIDYMDKNTDVAILGVSYSTMMSQSLIRNNFTPHIQSFFLLTTIDVLNEIVKKNGGVFPGKGINHKLLLIREGEIRISTLALDLGYSLAVVLDSGTVFKFNQTDKMKNCYQQWDDLPKGDMRVYVDNPNKINVIYKA